MPDSINKIASDLSDFIDAKFEQFKKEVYSIVKTHRIGPEQIKPGSVIIPKLNPSVNDHIKNTMAPAFVELAETKTTIFYQPSAPSSPTTGDVWYDTDSDPVIIYRWGGEDWTDITSSALSSALAAAGDAQATADGKIRTFSQATAPTGMTAGDVGDLWIDTDDNNKLYRWNSSAWISVQDGSKLDADSPAVGVQAPGMSIVSGEMDITASILSINVSGTAGDMTLDEKGVSIDQVNSPSVAPRYTGHGTLTVNKSATNAQVEAGTHFRSISDAFASIEGKRIPSTVTINITAGTYYENPYLSGVVGNGAISIVGNGAKVGGRIRFVNIGVVIWYTALDVSQVTPSSHGLEVSGCRFIQIANSTFTGLSAVNLNYAAILVENGSHAEITGCSMYGAGWRATISRRNAIVVSINNKGNQRHSYSGGAHLTIEGTQPSEGLETYQITTRGTGGVLHQPGSVSVDMGTATPPEPEVVTQTFSATQSRTVYGSAEWPGSWLSTTDKTWQGYTNGNGRMATLLWFSGLGALSGKTIRSARLRLHRNAGSGKGSAVNVVGHYGARAYNAGSGSPTDRVGMGTLGNISEGDTKYFDIPTAAVAYLAGGASNRCIALHPLDSSVMSGKSYSTNYCKYDGVGSAGIPVLEVTYEN
jgi:hypothetical protein